MIHRKKPATSKPLSSRRRSPGAVAPPDSRSGTGLAVSVPRAGAVTLPPSGGESPMDRLVMLARRDRERRIPFTYDQETKALARQMIETEAADAMLIACKTGISYGSLNRWVSDSGHVRGDDQASLAELSAAHRRTLDELRAEMKQCKPVMRYSDEFVRKIQSVRDCGLMKSQIARYLQMDPASLNRVMKKRLDTSTGTSSGASPHSISAGPAEGKARTQAPATPAPAKPVSARGSEAPRSIDVDGSRRDALAQELGDGCAKSACAPVEDSAAALQRKRKTQEDDELPTERQSVLLPHDAGYPAAAGDGSPAALAETKSRAGLDDPRTDGARGVATRETVDGLVQTLRDRDPEGEYPLVLPKKTLWIRNGLGQTHVPIATRLGIDASTVTEWVLTSEKLGFPDDELNTADLRLQSPYGDVGAPPLWDPDADWTESATAQPPDLPSGKPVSAPDTGDVADGRGRRFLDEPAEHENDDLYWTCSHWSSPVSPPRDAQPAPTGPRDGEPPV